MPIKVGDLNSTVNSVNAPPAIDHRSLRIDLRVVRPRGSGCSGSPQQEKQELADSMRLFKHSSRREVRSSSASPKIDGHGEAFHAQRRFKRANCTCLRSLQRPRLNSKPLERRASLAELVSDDSTQEILALANKIAKTDQVLLKKEKELKEARFKEDELDRKYRSAKPSDVDDGRHQGCLPSSRYDQEIHRGDSRYREVVFR